MIVTVVFIRASALRLATLQPHILTQVTIESISLTNSPTEMASQESRRPRYLRLIGEVLFHKN